MQTIALHTESANLTEDQFFMLCVDNKDLRIERDKHKNIIIYQQLRQNCDWRQRGSGR